MRLLAALVFCLGLSSLAACSDDEGDCKDLCARGNACTEDPNDGIECDEFCGGLSTITETNCGKEYNDLLKCEKDAEDLCSQPCSDDLNALGACVLLYCGSEFAEPGCDDVRDGLSR